MLRIFSFISAITLLTAFSACDLTQDIELDLPEYAKQPVVECYLEPGQPYRLTLTQSQPYFDSTIVEPIQTASVMIIRAGTDTIRLTPGFYTDSLEKLYNYQNTRLVPAASADTYELYITMPDGKKVYGKTSILPKVKFDSIVVKKNPIDTNFTTLSYMKDPDQNTTNFIRRHLAKGFSLTSIEKIQDFVTDDRLLSNNQWVFGMGYDLNPGDTLWASVFHIDQGYHDFLQSVENARQSNGNPFAQPGAIISNLNGAIGIFTGLSFERRRLIMPK
jgi:hypothetical protein